MIKVIKNKNGRARWTGLIFIAAVAGGYGYYHHKIKAGASLQGGGTMPSPVTTAKAVLQPWPTRIEATGTVSAEQGVMLKAALDGRITRIYIRSGETVPVGGMLFDIDPAAIKAQLAEAQAKAALSLGDYHRAVQLFNARVLSRHDLETARAQKEADAATVLAAQARLDQAVVRAPFTGTLGLTQVKLGDYVTAGQNLINLQSLDPLRVDFSVPQDKVSLVKTGDSFQVDVAKETCTRGFLKGTVMALDSALEKDSRSLGLRGLLPNPDHCLWPGYFVNVILYAGPLQSYITVPETALVYDMDTVYVYSIDKKNRAIKQKVMVIEKDKSRAAVLPGQALKAGDTVITEGQLKLQEGSAVYAVH